MTPTNNELEPCYSCKHGMRVWHDVLFERGYETVVCQCPNAGKGCDDCNTPGAVLVRIEGVEQ